MHYLTQIGAILAFGVTRVIASYSFYVGSDLTASGAVLLGGTGEEVSSHWLQIYPATDHPPNATMTVGVTKDAVLPGKLIQIPQARHTFKYISMDYSDYLGFPAPLTNGGLNENGVAVRDVWAPIRVELLHMTPNPQTGLSYSDLAFVVMQRAHSAREGVEIIGKMIKEHGYATYGGNTHMIADKDEGWVVWEFPGGQGLWAAERFGSDQVKVLYPGSIGDFPVDFHNNPNYTGSDNIVSFAVDHGWWSADCGKPFNIQEVYGLQPNQTSVGGPRAQYVSPAQLENKTLAMVPITEEDLMERVRDPLLSNDEAGYGQVVSLPGDTDPDLLRIWNAPTSAIGAPFIPWWIGVQSVPPEYAEHRYLTKRSGSSFLNPPFELREASLFAGRLYKRVLYYMCSSPHKYHPIVTEMFMSFESQSVSDLEWVEKSAKALLSEGERDAMRELLTFYSHSRANRALEIGRSMVNALDGYIKLAGLWLSPSGDQINLPSGGDPVNCLIGIDPMAAPDDQPKGIKPVPSDQEPSGLKPPGE